MLPTVVPDVLNVSSDPVPFMFQLLKSPLATLMKCRPPDCTAVPTVVLRYPGTRLLACPCSRWPLPSMVVRTKPPFVLSWIIPAALWLDRLRELSLLSPQTLGPRVPDVVHNSMVPPSV